MASSAQNQNPVEAIIEFVENLGLLDSQLGKCYSLKKYNNNQLLVDLLATFLTEAPASLAKMDTLMTADVVNFVDLAEESVKLVGMSGSVGAVQLKGACYSLWEAAENQSKEGCLEHLNAAKNAYATVKPHLEEILELENLNLRG